ncbi:ABC transporter ATP-binding protein [Virgibacillus proomii]|jgi:ATP-binding cassette, subfamily B, bacterial AbcA/BmrA|uniref:ABC transporter ATP-binding protein n=1 Tax=Virgibacillus proomii TaxID=84407 RepID=UPI001FE2FE7C|nr:ABC transporter ATP-binding protein [Virgibacillus proomii]
MSKRSLLIPFIITAISSVLSLIIPLFVMIIMDNLEKYIDYRLITIGIVLLTVSTILSAVSTFLLSRVAEKIILKLREKIWDKILKLPLKFHQKNRSGELVSRLTNDTIAIVDVMTHSLVDLFESIITLIVSLIILFYLDSYLTLILVVLVPFSIFIIYPLGEKIFSISYKEQERIADLTSFSSGILKDIKMVKAFNAEDIEKNKGENKFQHLYKLGIKSSILNSVITPLLGLFSFTVLIVIVGLGAWRVSNGTISMGELVAFIIYLVQVVTPFFAMNLFITDYQEAKGSMKRILEVLREKDEIDNQINKHSLLPIHSEPSRLDFKNVSFAYDENQKILHNISFSLETGEIVALVGPSGSGKSTIFSLIERFYPPSHGDMMLNNKSYQDIDISSWRKVFSYVPQDFPLFYGTIKDNLLYGLQEKVSMEELIEATKKANAHEFIMKFPHGYNTHVGEFGNFLSGGQKQRIAIARALLRKSKFILLDEVTANLDSESEYLLQHTLISLAQNKIGVFMIAHRLSTVKRADKILVLENGNITGYGTHDYLYRTNHHYKDSVDKQKA